LISFLAYALVSYTGPGRVEMGQQM
jgi:hypothetical protein